LFFETYDGLKYAINEFEGCTVWGLLGELGVGPRNDISNENNLATTTTFLLLCWNAHQCEIHTAGVECQDVVN